MENNMLTGAAHRILVTGSSGFIGTNLVSALIEKEISVLGIDIAPPRNIKHKNLFQSIDILDAKSLNDVVSKFLPEIVIHLGARTDLLGESLDDYKANHEGTQNVMEVCRQAPTVKRIIFASSRLVNKIGDSPKSYDDYSPTTPYGESKVMGEKIIKNAPDLPYDWCIVRPTSIWGPWFQIPYRTFFDAVLAGQYVHPKGQRIEKSFGFVGNSVNQIICLATAPKVQFNKKTFYLADYDPIEVFSFSRNVAKQAGRGAVREVPISVLKLGALIGDGLKILGVKNPPLTTFRLNNLITPMHYDTQNLLDITGSLPYSQDMGIAETLEWMKLHEED